ncbi:MAG: sodium:solute symporter family protein [Gammaproteobacteria bacterium]|nr:sodium:solute symporter family protein [Gammaproteobacteria bacterium]
MDIYSISILVSIMVYIAVGNYAGRRVKHLEDYFVAGRQAPTIMIVGTLVASYLSTNTFMAETGMAYSNWAGPWILFPPLAAMGYIYGSLFFGRYLRRSSTLTVSEFFGKRFDSPRVRAVAGVSIVLGLGCYLLAVTQGAAILLSQISPLSYTQSLLIAWASYTLFTLYSGSRGVVITDTLMFLLFSSVSFLALYYLIDFNGGWLNALTELVTLEEKPDLMAWYGRVGPGMDWETPSDLIIWSIIIGIAWSLVVAISPWQSSRYLMAKNEHVVIRSGCIAAVALVSIAVSLSLVASTVNLSKTDIMPQEQSIIWAALNILPPLLGALLLAGIMSAALSSASTFLSLVGFSVSNDILPSTKLISAESSGLSLLGFSRVTMLVVGAIVLVISLFIEPNIFWLTYFAGTVFASSWGPVAFMSIWSDRITASAAFWGMISGFVGNVIPKLLDTLGLIDLPTILDPFVIGAVVSLVVISTLSRVTRVTDEQRKYRLSLHVVPEEECAAKLTRHTQWAALLLGAYGLVVTTLLVNFYIKPYQSIVGTLLDDQTVNWFTGEALHAIAWLVVLVSFSALAYWAIGRSYKIAGDTASVGAANEKLSS